MAIVALDTIIDLLKLDIREAVTDKEIVILSELAESVSREGMMIAEIGCWKGYTTCHLGQIAKKHCGHVYAVDHWKGNIGTDSEGTARNENIFAIFQRNVDALRLGSVIIPLSMDSLSASRTMADNSLDMVFIDADHRYTPFVADVKAWLPKVRHGGILCGHDCDFVYSQATVQQKPVIDTHLEQDYYQYGHHGVSRGLFDIFNDKYERKESIWYLRKNNA